MNVILTYPYTHTGDVCYDTTPTPSPLPMSWLPFPCTHTPSPTHTPPPNPDCCVPPFPNITKPTDLKHFHRALNLQFPNYCEQDLGHSPSHSIYSLRPTNLFFRARQGRLLVLILVRWVSLLFLLSVLFCFLWYIFRHYLLRFYL